MKQLGIKSEEIDAESVVINKRDGGKMIINNPSIQKIEMQGNESFQITGDISEEGAGAINEEDVKLVMEKSGKSEEESRKALEETEDIAEAIVKLSK